MNETVKEHCRWRDCKYRTRFDSQPSCGYMIITGRPRGCKISECDKYEPGKVKIVSRMEGMRYVIK